MAIKAMASAAMQATMLSTISNIAAQVIEANRDNVWDLGFYMASCGG